MLKLQALRPAGAGKSKCHVQIFQEFLEYNITGAKLSEAVLLVLGVRRLLAGAVAVVSEEIPSCHPLSNIQFFDVFSSCFRRIL